MNYATPIGYRHPPVDWHNPPGPSPFPLDPSNNSTKCTHCIDQLLPISRSIYPTNFQVIPFRSADFSIVPTNVAAPSTPDLRDTLFDELLRIILLNIYTNFVRVHYRVRIKGLTLLRFFETDPLWNGTLAYVRTPVYVYRR